MTEVLSLSAVELAAAIKEGRTTAVEAMEAVFGQIDKKEQILHCYVTLDKKKALEKAEAVQKKIETGELDGPLAGVPMAVKDNLCTEGMRTTCASKMLDNFIPTYSAEAVLQLEKAGAVLIGKTNMDEFAMGSTTETSAYGVTRNPHNQAHVPGGSSGGSAAAVAAGECFFALGSDTGGSIRQPASYCGVVGLKPTYGTVSRYGLVAYGSSLDQIGPLGRTVEDCAVILEAISGFDEKDSTQIKRDEGILCKESLLWKEGVSEDKDISGKRDIPCRQGIPGEDKAFSSGLNQGVKGMRIGIPRAYIHGEGLDVKVRDAVLKAAEVLKAEGAIVEEFDLGLVEYAIPAYYTIAAAEASSNLERFDGVKYGFRAEADELHQMYKKTRSQGFGPEVKRRIMLGSYVLSSGYYDAYYLKALRVKAMIKRGFDEAFAEYDCILGPTAPTTAPKLGESLADPIKMYLGDIYTISVNLAGLPGISVPCGTDDKGLPVGLQLIGDCFQEKKILRAAYAVERSVKKCPQK